ncbi:MAG: hypothetical protein ACOX6T_22635 [Myxococcales bacterium]|jgi:hypothetical protein
MAAAAPGDCGLPETVPPTGVPPPALSRGAEAGRDLLLDQIGEGAMGVIYAYAPELDRRVAIRLPKPEPGTGSVSDKSRSRLQREAQWKLSP